MIAAKVVGLEETKRAIEALGELGEAAVLADALKRVGKPMAEEMSALCPRDTGLTAADFRVGVSKELREEGHVRVLVGARSGRTGRAWIAKFIEYGTSKMPARPFIRPTWDRHRREFVPAVTRELRTSYERITKRLVRFAQKRGMAA